MQITDIDEFLHYFSRIKFRTKRVIDTIPEDKFSWRPSKDTFTIGEIIIHISNINYQMYGCTILDKNSTYSGHTLKDMSGKNVKNYYEESYNKVVQTIEKLHHKDLTDKILTPAGVKITSWKWLRAMIEHEIHHRGQIYLYLKLLKITTPPLYGLTSEEVRERSDKI